MEDDNLHTRLLDQMGPAERIVRTPNGSRLVNKRLWDATARTVAKMEPALAQTMKDLAVSLIPSNWPRWFQGLVREGIQEIDGRASPASQRMYRQGIAGRLSQGQAPNYANTMALWCFGRGYLHSSIIGGFRDKGYEWMTGPDVEFENHRQAIRPVGSGADSWVDVASIELPDLRKERKRHIPPRERPVYRHEADGTITLLQPDLTEVTALARQEDMLACHDRLEISSQGEVVFPPAVTDSQPHPRTIFEGHAALGPDLGGGAGAEESNATPAPSQRPSQTPIQPPWNGDDYERSWTPGDDSEDIHDAGHQPEHPVLPTKDSIKDEYVQRRADRRARLIRMNELHRIRRATREASRKQMDRFLDDVRDDSEEPMSSHSDDDETIRHSDTPPEQQQSQAARPGGGTGNKGTPKLAKMPKVGKKSRRLRLPKPNVSIAEMYKALQKARQQMGRVHRHG